MASFRCYDNSDVIKTLLMTNFHLNLIKLWWQFFQMFVYCDVVMLEIGRYWPWKTSTVSSHLHMPARPMLLHRMALVSFLLFHTNLCNLREFFGQMVYCPPGKKLPVRQWSNSILKTCNWNRIETCHNVWWLSFAGMHNGNVLGCYN